MNDNSQSYYTAAAQLPQAIAEVLLRVPSQMAKSVTEIRLRSGRSVMLSTAKQSWFVATDGETLSDSAQNTLFTTHSDLAECFHALCAYSVHSFQTCIAQGFVPLRGGHRAGICGTAICDASGNIATIKNMTSINIRIARTALCTCDAALQQALCAQGGILLVGEPGSGKTTLLRAMIQLLCVQGVRVAAVDERFEIAPVEQSGFAVEMPLHCDVLSGYPKHIGMMHALRSLAPDILLCDEIGTMEDVYAVQRVANAGVRMIVTLHGSSYEQLQQRPQVKALLETKAFSMLVLLEGKSTPGKVKEVLSLANAT